MTAHVADARVSIANGWAVWLEGRLLVAGESLDLDRDTAQHWISRGWAVLAPRPDRDNDGGPA